MTRTRPPEKLDMQPADIQRNGNFLFLTSLHHCRSGWFANHALQPTPIVTGSSASAGRATGPEWLGR